MDYGYIRVSSVDQHEDRQLIAMREQGIPDRNIYIDKQSGKNFERPMWKRMVNRLKPGDVLFVKSIDRLGRNYDEILFQWRFLTQKKECSIVVLDMPLLDTREKKDLMGKVISDIVLQLLSYVAQTEREFIRQRQAEGIAAARARGVQFGRKPRPLPENFHEVLELYRTTDLTQKNAARMCGIPESTYRYYLKKLNCGNKNGK